MTIDEAKNLKKVDENTDCIVQLIDTAAKVMVEAFENLNIEDVNMFQLGYNKAIDDFVKLVHKHDWNIRNINENSFIYGAIDTLAEQLKAGGENECGSGKVCRLSD